MTDQNRPGHASTEAAPLAFFLGGNDLEMEEIRTLLATVPACEVHDRRLAWGASTSHYANEIRAAAARGARPVLVELTIDTALDLSSVVVVDHHGARAGHDVPTSLEQVFALLGRPQSEWSRWRALVAANDRGYIDEMQAMGATLEEITAVRAADRHAQGVTADQEALAERALEAVEQPCDSLIIVRLAHTRTAPVTDRLHRGLGGPGYRNLLIVCPGENYFFGDGEHVKALSERRHDFFGGSLPQRGFWGMGSVEGYLRERICCAAS